MIRFSLLARIWGMPDDCQKTDHLLIKCIGLNRLRSQSSLADLVGPKRFLTLSFSEAIGSCPNLCHLSYGFLQYPLNESPLIRSSFPRKSQQDLSRNASHLFLLNPLSMTGLSAS